MTDHFYRTQVEGRKDHDARVAEAVAYGFLLAGAIVFAGALLLIAFL